MEMWCENVCPNSVSNCRFHADCVTELSFPSPSSKTSWGVQDRYWDFRSVERHVRMYPGHGPGEHIGVHIDGPRISMFHPRGTRGYFIVGRLKPINSLKDARSLKKKILF